MGAFNQNITGNGRIESRETLIVDEVLIVSELLTRVSDLETNFSSYETANDEVIDGIGDDITDIESDIESLAARVTAIETELAKTHVVRVTDDYTPVADDIYIFCNTDDGEFEITFPSGTEGRHIKIMNTGSNDLILTPYSGEQIWGNGEDVSVTLKPGDIINLHYELTEGWW